MPKRDESGRPPCPFCGSANLYIDEYLVVECRGCGAFGPDIQANYDMDDPEDYARAQDRVWAAWGRRGGAATTPGAAGAIDLAAVARASEFGRFPQLTDDENEAILQARAAGFAVFYPSYPTDEAQARNTLKGAREFLSTKETAR